MSRRGDDRYDDSRSDYNRRSGRRDQDYEEVDYQRTRYDGPAPSGRAQTQVKERDIDTRSERGPRQPDFLREDYGRNANAGQMVVRDEVRVDDYAGSRVGRSRGPPQGDRVERDEIVFQRREAPRNPPYPQSNIGDDEIVFRERTRSRPPPAREEIDITIREKEDDRRPPPRGRAEVDTEEVIFTREERSLSRPPPPRRVREEVDIDIREQDSYRSRDVRREEIDIDIKESDNRRGRDGRKEEIDIDIDIQNRGAPAPRERSQSRGALVRKDREEWIVRKRRTPSPSPSPPPRDFEREQIVIRTRTPEPEPPPREPTPEPLPPPEPPVYRPPIIQEVITHHRHIDHPIERARSPTPPPPPPVKKEEEDIDITIHRTGIRNGKPFDENINIDIDTKDREVARRDVDLRRSASVGRPARGYEEVDYYNRQNSRGYGAYNGGYDSGRNDRQYAGDRRYDGGYRNGGQALAPPPVRDEYRFSETRIERETTRGKTQNRRWTEVTKDLVIEEAIREQGYEFEESEGYFYVMEYLRYVSCPTLSPNVLSPC